MSLKLIRLGQILILIITLNVDVYSQGYLCNIGFENHKAGQTFPSFIAEVSLSDCWKDDVTLYGGYLYHSPDWFVFNEFHLIEDISNDGNFLPILGNNGSNGYCGMRSCEMIQQQLITPLNEDDLYAVTFYIRVPASPTQSDPYVNGFNLNSGGEIELEFCFSNDQLEYQNEVFDCLDGNTCYGWANISIKQKIKVPIDLSKYVPGQWFKLSTKIFSANQDWDWMTIQSNAKELYCSEDYFLLDDIVIVDQTCPICESCSFTSEPAVVSCNLANTGLEPLTFSNLENVKSLNLEITNTLGQYIMSASASCANGWDDGEWQVHIPPSLNLATANYYAYLTIENDCGACLKKYTFLYLDHYLGSFNACECREEGIIKPCCEDQYDAEQYVQTCQTGTLLYQAINDLKVGFNSDFTVENGTDVYFTANNSIEFGPNFKSENNGTFLAEITACSQNKKGNDDFVQKDDNPFKEDESREDLIQCFPNPSNGFINVLTRYDSNSELTIYSVLGERLGQHTVHGKELTQIELHAAGVYIFSFSSNGTVINKEVIIQ